MITNLPGMEVSTVRVSEKTTLVGKSIADMQLRKKYGVALLAIKRGTELLSNPDGQTHVMGGDILILLGSPENLSVIAGQLHGS